MVRQNTLKTQPSTPKHKAQIHLPTTPYPLYGRVDFAQTVDLSKNGSYCLQCCGHISL